MMTFGPFPRNKLQIGIIAGPQPCSYISRSRASPFYFKSKPHGSPMVRLQSVHGKRKPQTCKWEAAVRMQADRISKCGGAEVHDSGKVLLGCEYLVMSCKLTYHDALFCTGTE